MAKALISQFGSFRCSWIVEFKRKVVLLLFVSFLVTAEIFNHNELNFNVVAASDFDDNNNNLKLSLSNFRRANSMEQQMLDSSSGIMRQILSDDYSGDFRQTTEAVQSINASLEKFAKLIGINPQNVLSNTKLVTHWLDYKTLTSQQYYSRNPIIEQVANELDFIYSNFWAQFSQLLHKIISEHPANLSEASLDFRCSRYNEINALKELSLSSPIYRLVLDIFSTELYTHCLIRKLAIFKIYQIKPTSILRQFVDIYLDLPPINHKGEVQERVLEKLHSINGTSFNLEQNIKKHGPLKKVAELVFDEHSSFLFSGSKSIEDIKRLVERFKQDCRKHRSDLGRVWHTFDELASYLSSPLNDLKSFNEAIKLSAPQFIYGTICGHLE